MEEKGLNSLLNNTNVATSNRQVQTTPRDAINSPWFQVEEGSTATIRQPRAKILLRSVSTYNYPRNKPHQNVKACPFPSLPTKQEVQNVKNEVVQEIHRLTAELTSLQYDRNMYNQSHRPLIPSSSTNGIHEYRGLVITDQTIDEIIKDNKQKAVDSKKTVLLDNGVSPKFKRPTDLPFYRKMLEVQNEILVPMYSVKHAEREILMEKEDALAEEYNKRYEIWEKEKELYDEISNMTEKKNEEWPPEFNFDRPSAGVTNEQRLKWAAEDFPMIISPAEKEARLYYDTNGFIKDPVTAFKEYRNRIAWTEEDTRIFFEKYRQHPKDFKKIADALPDKSIKEVIEFYYLNRYRLSLKENEGMAKRRGGKKKVITEGSSKKVY